MRRRHVWLQAAAAAVFVLLAIAGGILLLTRVGIVDVITKVSSSGTDTDEEKTIARGKGSEPSHRARPWSAGD